MATTMTGTGATRRERAPSTNTTVFRIDLDYTSEKWPP
jgi:hypothetical protein